MNLSFSKEFPWGAPTYFAEKIWLANPWTDVEREKFEGWPSLILSSSIEPKLHTIREDSKDRWKEGMKVHCIYNNRSPNRYQFCPTFHVVSTQTIEIRIIHGFLRSKEIEVFVDGKEVFFDTIKEIAINDGFKHIDDFIKWFSKSFRGKIIHWTDKRY